MSTYEDYADVSSYYDNGRQAAGVEMFSTTIQGYLKKPMQKIHLLDAGCGTGNYSKGFLDNGIGKVSALDASQGMLSKAKDKLTPYSKDSRVGDIIQGQLPQIAFNDACFDAVTFIQVLQHLDKPYEGFTDTKSSILEAFRVLKPGGVLLINTSTHDQLRYGEWYRNLLPHSVENQCDRFIPVTELLAFLKEQGFEKAAVIVCPWESILTDEQYFNMDGPFDESWRRINSVWKIAENGGELATALKTLKEKKDFGIFDDWFEQVEEKRKNLGLTTTIFVQKPQSGKQ